MSRLEYAAGKRQTTARDESAAGNSVLHMGHVLPMRIQTHAIYSYGGTGIEPARHCQRGILNPHLNACFMRRIENFPNTNRQQSRCFGSQRTARIGTVFLRPHQPHPPPPEPPPATTSGHHPVPSPLAQGVSPSSCEGQWMTGGHSSAQSATFSCQRNRVVSTVRSMSWLPASRKVDAVG